MNPSRYSYLLHVGTAGTAATTWREMEFKSPEWRLLCSHLIPVSQQAKYPLTHQTYVVAPFY